MLAPVWAVTGGLVIFAFCSLHLQLRPFLFRKKLVLILQYFHKLVCQNPQTCLPQNAIAKYCNSRNETGQVPGLLNESCKMGRAFWVLLKFVKMFLADFGPAYETFSQRPTLSSPVTVGAIESE